MNSVIFPQLIKSLISDLLCCFWEDVLWLLRRGWLMCLFVCCSLENSLSCISFCFGQGFSRSWRCRRCQSWWRGRQAAGRKGLSPLCYHGYNPCLTLHSILYASHTRGLILVFWQGRYEGNSLAGLKPASLMRVFCLNCLTPFLIGVQPTGHWGENPVMEQSPRIQVGRTLLSSQIYKIAVETQNVALAIWVWLIALSLLSGKAIV